MSRWVSDAHALLWHLYAAPQLSARVRDVFEQADAGEHIIIIPAIALVEIIYLSEKGKIASDAVQRVIDLLRAGSENYQVAPLDLDVTMALGRVDRNTVPDMPDRIIAATALHLDLPLLTRDPKIAALNLFTPVW